jgi:hypothetical protein
MQGPILSQDKARPLPQSSLNDLGNRSSMEDMDSN